jgi:ribosomal protein L36
MVMGLLQRSAFGLCRVLASETRVASSYLQTAAWAKPFQMQFSNGLKVRSAIKKMCESCQVIKRGKKLRVNCTRSPKHRQRQGMHTLAMEILGR